MKKLIKICIPIILLLVIINNNKTTTISQNRKLYKGERVERASEYLMVRSNIDSITSYDEGNTREMYTFNYPATAETEELTYYRYIGNDANNYVYFNCQDDNKLDTCELWRIIGVFRVEDEFGNLEYRLKIMRNEPIGKYAWNSSLSNDWNSSSLFNTLNDGDFWYSLSSNAQDMVGTTRFALSDDFKSNDDSFIGNVGLILPSDYSYSYSLGVDNNCFNNMYACENKELSWLNVNDTFWTIAPVINSNNAYIISNVLNQSNAQVTNAYDVYPTLYLKYNIVIDSGNGSEGDAYILRLMNDSDIQSEMDMLENNDDVGDKSVVNVSNTSSIVSTIILIISGGVIIIGIGILLFNYFKSRKK